MVTARLAAVSVVSTTAFMGLAILGEGGWSQFTSHPALVGLLITTLGLVVASLFTSGNLNPGEREDRTNRWVLMVFAILGLLAAWLPAYTDQKNVAVVGGETMRWIGVGLYAVGSVLRLVPVFILGRRFSGLVAIQRDHRLVTTGLYSKIRHPSYLGMLILSLGWSLAFRSLVGVGLTILTVIPVMGRINAEEALLAQTFGAEYAAYRARTWRLVPGVY